MPSPLRSWWKMVSIDCSAVLLPDTGARYSSDKVAVAVDAPHGVLAGRRVLPGHVIARRATCSAPIAVQPPLRRRYNGHTALFQFGAGAAACMR